MISSNRVKLLKEIKDKNKPSFTKRFMSTAKQLRKIWNAQLNVRFKMKYPPNTDLS